MPRHSIIVPCHNGAPHLGAAVESCLAQTERDLEVIVVDDGSTDTSAAIVRRAMRADARVRLIEQPRRGVGAARNAGLESAVGDCVSFLDADDVLEPQKLAVQGAVLAANPAIGIVLCDGVVIDRDGRVVWNGLVDASRFAGHPPLFEVCFRGGPFPPLVPLVRRSLAAAVGGFEVDPVAAGWADIDFWMRLALAGADYHFVSERLVRYRQTQDSMSSDRVGMERAARFVFAKVMREHPLEAVLALRAAHRRLADHEFAQHQLRALVADLVAERAALAAQRDALTAERHSLAADNHRLRQGRAEARWALMEVLAHPSDSSGSRPLMIWGAGAAGRGLLRRLQRSGGRVSAFIDSDARKEGSRVADVPVMGPAAAFETRAGLGPFVLVASVYATAIEAQLHALGRRAGLDYSVVDVDEITDDAQAVSVRAARAADTEAPRGAVA